MPVHLAALRDELLPGLHHLRSNYAIAESFAQTKEVLAATVLNSQPKPVSIPAAIAMGIAAAVISNPIVPRRSLFGGWWK